MGKLDDFYKKAEGDAALKNALSAVKRRYDDRTVAGGTIIGDIITLAKEHTGIDLTPADFVPDTNVPDDELAAVSGGTVISTLKGDKLPSQLQPVTVPFEKTDTVNPYIRFPTFLA